MNILELDSYNLDDAVKFHDKLNPLLWDKSEHLHPNIREQLLKIADDFCIFLGVQDLDLKDITISGSNAAYTYTPHSDIDLHLIVDLPDAETNEVYRELFDAKKFIYNTEHKITIKGIPVELYVQDANEEHHSQGIYSILNNTWLQVPKRRRADIDDMSVKSKYKDLAKRIKEAIKSKSVEKMTDVLTKIKNMRGAGLAAHGEFGPENLAFKMLRNTGELKKIHDARKEAKSKELSLKERQPQPVKYGFGKDYIEEVGMTPDGTNPSTAEFTNEEQLDEVGMTPDGTNPTTCMFANESSTNKDKEIVQDFVNFCVDQLGLDKNIKLRIRRDPQWSVRNKTFGRYNNGTNELEVSLANRHIMDALRTIAHELTHQRQGELDQMSDDSGEDGSPQENEANAAAGVIMRRYGKLHPELFANNTLDENIEEGIGQKIAAATAVVAALAGNPAAAQSVQGILGGVRDIATIANTAKNITRAGINQEVQQEIINYIQANGGQANAQNLSHLYKLQKELQRQETDPQPLPGYTQQTNPPVQETAQDERFLQQVGNAVEQWAEKYKATNKERINGFVEPGTLGQITGIQGKTDAEKHLLNLGMMFFLLPKSGGSRPLGAYRPAKGEWGGDIAADVRYLIPDATLSKTKAGQEFTHTLLTHENDLGSTVAHELRHALDDYLSKGKYDSSAHKFDYYDQNVEINAFFTQALKSLQKMIDEGIVDQDNLQWAIRRVFYNNELISELIANQDPRVKRLFSRAYNYFKTSINKDEQLNEASGYIPTAAEADDPRFEMALTVDVHPGEIGRCANAFLLNTDSQGHPQELRPDGLVKRMMEDLELFKRNYQ